MSPRFSHDAEAGAQFLLEARAVNEIGHPNIVDVFSCGRLNDGRSYLVMEWLEGQTLAEHLATRRDRGPSTTWSRHRSSPTASCTRRRARADRWWRSTR